MHNQQSVIFRIKESAKYLKAKSNEIVLLKIPQLCIRPNLYQDLHDTLKRNGLTVDKIDINILKENGFSVSNSTSSV